MQMYNAHGQLSGGLYENCTVYNKPCLASLAEFGGDSVSYFQPEVSFLLLLEYMLAVPPGSSPFSLA